MTLLASAALALVVAQASAPPPAPTAPPTGAPLAAAAPAPGPGPGAEVLTLDDALRIAEQQNLDLKVAQARLRQADELSWKAWSRYLPQLAVSGSYTRNQYAAEFPFATQYYVRDMGAPQGPPPGGGNPGGTPTNLAAFPDMSTAEIIPIQKQDQLGAQAELTQALLAPQLWFAIPNASRGEEIARLGVEGVRREVLFGVAQAFYGVASLRQALQASERLLEIAQRQEKDARVRYQAGAIAKVGLLRAEIDRARAEQDLRRARNAYESGRIALATLLDRKPDFDIADPPDPQLTPDPAALETAALHDRTDVQAARVQRELARGTRSQAVARYLPNVGAFARWMISNTGGFTGQNDQWAVGLGLQWQILDGGLRESDIREASAKIAEADASAAGTEARARQEVQQTLLDLESARANAAKAKEQRDLAAENQRLVDVAYRAGTATTVEQADATAQLRTAEIAFTAESLGAQLAALRVLKAVGAFHPTRR